MGCGRNSLPPIYKGDDASFTILVLLPDGSKMNFNGTTVKFILKKNKAHDDSTAVVEKTYTFATDTTELYEFLSQEDTDITPGIYEYGVRVIVDGLQTTELTGLLEIKQGPFYAK